MEFTNEQIQEKFENLPADLKEALSSAEVLKNLREISESHDFLLDRAAILEQEVSLILLGMVPSSEFVSRLKDELDLSSKEAAALASEINEKIFKTFRAALMQVHGEKALEFPQVEEKEDALDRDEILREIERINNGEIVVEKTAVSLIKATEDQEKIKSSPQNKLSEVHKSAKEYLDVSPKAEIASEKSVKRPVDPYREPIE